MNWRGLIAAPALLFALAAQAQTPEAPPPPDGATLFKNQCATCHSLKAGEQRQGPSLAGIVGRKAASVPDFKYSEPMKKADFAWDEQRLDAWLTNPQAVVPGTIMVYKQAKANVRAAIIAHLKEQH